MGTLPLMPASCGKVAWKQERQSCGVCERECGSISVNSGGEAWGKRGRGDEGREGVMMVSIKAKHN